MRAGRRGWRRSEGRSRTGDVGFARVAENRRGDTYLITLKHVPAWRNCERKKSLFESISVVWLEKKAGETHIGVIRGRTLSTRFVPLLLEPCTITTLFDIAAPFSIAFAPDEEAFQHLGGVSLQVMVTTNGINDRERRTKQSLTICSQPRYT